MITGAGLVAAAIATLILTYFVVRVTVLVVRFVRSTPAARRNHWLVFKIWARWRKTTQIMGLVWIKKETTAISSRRSFAPHVFATMVGRSKTRQVIVYPRVKIRADEYGAVLRVRTLPKIGREEWEKAAPYLADRWGCPKVQVFQTRPGRLIVRALRVDPLAMSLDLADVPVEVYES